MCFVVFVGFAIRNRFSQLFDQFLDFGTAFHNLYAHSKNLIKTDNILKRTGRHSRSRLSLSFLAVNLPFSVANERMRKKIVCLNK